MSEQTQSSPTIRWFLRLEGLAIFLAAIALYAATQGNAWAFVLLLLVPDISAVGYLVNPALGSQTYNIAHTYLIPLLLVGLGMALGNVTVQQFGFIWLAHIGMDRTIGYGLKYPVNFKVTHLQRV